MKVALYDSREFERKAFDDANFDGHELRYLPFQLSNETVEAARGCRVVCCFIHDCLTAPVLERLSHLGVELVALRCAGYNNADIEAARKLGISIVRVPEYSPYAVAEHAVGLLLSLNRKIHKAFNRVRELNFSIEGLVGVDLHGKTVGVIGAGKIGRVFCKIMTGFGCEVLVCDPAQSSKTGKIRYVELDELLEKSDVISLHVPLTPETRHILGPEAFGRMKKNVLVINTSRGALIDTHALIAALKQNRIGGACLDVYEEEENVFFKDLSQCGIGDDMLARLLTFPNVIVTAHQAFLTKEALANIAQTTLENITSFSTGQDLKFKLT